MPWSITQNHPECDADESWGVVNDDTGELVACHETEEDARQQVEALYANVEEAGKSAVEPEYKAQPAFTKEIEDRAVTGIFAVHGNIDEGADRSWPGAFADVAVKGRKRVRFVWQHSPFDPPIASINYIREVSRSELPGKVLEYAPDATGGVEVSRTYLDTPRGNEVLAGIKAGAIEEMSYSYNPITYDFEELDGRQVRNLRKVQLFDISDVLWGMNPATAAVKALKSWSGTDLTFSEHSDSVVLLLEEYARRAKDRSSFRAKEGRVLSEANRKRIASLVASLGEVTKDLEELLAATEPKASQADILAALARFEHTRYALHHIGAPTP